MSDSHISVSSGGTTFVGDDATRLFAACTLRSAIKLLRAGIKPTRGYTMTKALNATTLYTRKRYRRGEVDKALADLSVWIETMRAALPVVRE